MDVLEHVADDFGMFAELVAAANPGSHFLVTVPAAFIVSLAATTLRGMKLPRNSDRAPAISSGPKVPQYVPPAPVIRLYSSCSWPGQ